MEKIQEIIYLPSVRCNLNCKHCGEKQDITKEMEMNSGDILCKLAESSLIDSSMTIAISGGEPFLNLSLEQFILNGIRNTKFKFGVTTNGYFYDRIKQIVSQIEHKNRERLTFNISIDGVEKTHNKIRRNSYSFQNALKTIKYLVNEGLCVNINTVVQTDNIYELEELKAYFRKISPDIMVNFIPFATDIGEKDCGVYTSEYQERLWKYETSLLDKKKILSKGKFGVKGCHAGEKNIVIGPDGKVYVCLTGAYYKGKDERNKFCIGDLKEHTLDEILADRDKRSDVYAQTVIFCKGCSNPCELNREVNLYGQSLGISQTEISTAYQLDTQRRVGCALIDYCGWNDIERYEDGSCLCWSCDFVSKVFVANIEKNKKIGISYRKLIKEAKVKILINGKEVYVDSNSDLQRKIVVDIPSEIKKDSLEIKFVIDIIETPFELFKSEDHRSLGIGIEDIYVKE